MKTLSEHFDEFELATYGGKMSSEQASEVRKIFMAGAVVFAGAMSQAHSQGNLESVWAVLTSELQKFNDTVQAEGSNDTNRLHD